MAQRTWRGGATAVAQVRTATPANVEINDIFTLTLTDDRGSTASISFTATDVTVANVTAGLTAAWNGSEHPWFEACTAADDTTHVTITADSAGVPFALTSSTTDGGGNNTQTLTVATTTANVGPNDWNCTENWVEGAIPVNADDVDIPAGSAAILYTLNQSAVTLATLHQHEGHSANIGRIEDGQLYHLRVAVSAAPRLEGYGSLTALDIGASAVAVNSENDGSASVTGLYSLYVKGSAITSLTHEGSGSVAIGSWPGDTATVTASFVVTGGSVFVGAGTTIAGTTGKTTGSGTSLVSEAAIPTVTIANSASYTLAGTAGATTITVGRGCTFYDKTSGTITTLNARDEATIDKTLSTKTSTYTNTNIYGAVTWKDPLSLITKTNPPVVYDDGDMQYGD